MKHKLREHRYIYRKSQLTRIESALAQITRACLCLACVEQAKYHMEVLTNSTRSILRLMTCETNNCIGYHCRDPLDL